MTTKQLILPVTSMTCASCVNRIERGLRKVEGVETAQVNLATEQAAVSFNPAQVTASNLVAAIEKSVYGVITDRADNVVGIPVAARAFFPSTGWQLSPMIAVAAMAFSSVFVVTNSLRLRRVRLEPSAAPPLREGRLAAQV